LTIEDAALGPATISQARRSYLVDHDDAAHRGHRHRKKIERWRTDLNEYQAAGRQRKTDAAALQQIFMQISAQAETAYPGPFSGFTIGTFPDSPIILVW
jgi:hypothetical protein